MKLFGGYIKRKLEDTNLLLAGGGHKSLGDFIGSLQWDDLNRKLQYKSASATTWTDLVAFGSNAMSSTSYLPLTGGTITNGSNWAAINFSRIGVGSGTVGGIDANGLYFMHQDSAGTSSISMYLKAGEGLTVGGTKVSLEGHTHDYLPLSGGTLTNNVRDILSIKNTGSSLIPYITFYDSNNNHYCYVGGFNESDKYFAWLGCGSSRLFLDSTAGSIRVGTDSTNYKIWHEGNDGTGSGLDADTVDGKHASNFMTADGSNSWLVTEYYTGSVGQSTCHTVDYIRDNNLKAVRTKVMADSSITSGFEQSLSDYYSCYMVTYMLFSADTNFNVVMYADDAATIYINGEVAMTDIFYPNSKSGTLSFKQGWNAVEIVYHEHAGGIGLYTQYSGGTNGLRVVPNLIKMDCFYRGVTDTYWNKYTLYSTHAKKLYTKRTLTIGNTGKDFDGSSNVSWTLAEIGAQAAGSYASSSHDHDGRYVRNNGGWIPSTMTALGAVYLYGILGTNTSAYMGWAATSTDMQVYTDGKFWQREGAYYCLDNGNTYVTNGKGYINSTEVTEVNHAEISDFVRTPIAVTSRITSLSNLGKNNITVGSGRTLMRIDLASNNLITDGSYPPISGSGYSSAGFVLSFSWENQGFDGAAASQFYIPNGDHITTTNGLQTIMYRGNDNGTWSSWFKLVSAKTGSVGNSTLPMYIDAYGFALTCTAYSSASVNYANYAGYLTDWTRVSRVSKNSSNAEIETVTGWQTTGFIQIQKFCPTNMVYTTGDLPAPYGIGFGNGNESAGIIPMGNTSYLTDLIFYGANSGPTIFRFGRQLWDSTTYDSRYTNHYATYLSIDSTNGNLETSGYLKSTIATGTAPILVSSTTACGNLNADLLDGNHASAFATSGHDHDSRYHLNNGGWKSSTLSSYTYLCGWGATSSNGSLAYAGLCHLNGNMVIYTDGYFYLREGTYMCIDTGNWSDYCASKDHTHTSFGDKTVDNSTCKNVLIIEKGESSEASGENIGTASFGISFKRWWQGSYDTITGGIYAVGSSGWRSGIVIRTKNNTSSTGTPDVNALWLSPAGNGTFASNCYASNFYTTSDRSKKQNISSFSEHIRKFQLKDTKKWHYGVIAQEVEEMFRDGEEGSMTVNYNSVLSYYIGLLENKIKQLEEKINILENKQNK